MVYFTRNLSYLHSKTTELYKTTSLLDKCFIKYKKEIQIALNNPSKKNPFIYTISLNELNHSLEKYMELMSKESVEHYYHKN